MMSSALSRLIALSDYELEFMRALNEEGARFLIVGGRAVNFYRSARKTIDLDIFVGFEGENLVAVMAAMGRVDPRYFRRQWSASNVRPNVQAPVDLQQTHCDVLTSLPGLEFEPAWTARETAQLRGVKATVIALADLIANKRADLQRDPRAAADLELLLQVG